MMSVRIKKIHRKCHVNLPILSIYDHDSIIASQIYVLCKLLCKRFLRLFLFEELFDTLDAVDIVNILICLSLLQHVLDERFSSFITTPHERPRRNIQKSHLLRNSFPYRKLLGSNILCDFHMSFRGTHVLSKRHNIHIHIPQLYASAPPS